MGRGKLLNRKLLYLIAALPLMLGGCFLRTDYVLKSLNKPSDAKPEEAPASPSPSAWRD